MLDLLAKSQWNNFIVVPMIYNLRVNFYKGNYMEGFNFCIVCLFLNINRKENTQISYVTKVGVLKNMPTLVNTYMWYRSRSTNQVTCFHISHYIP